ncbi:hypothetical protein [Kitasatospora sp. NPDC127116]|uniref:hypothetical protein n=1 Tax=Kitasatospora sp. NPDC127116 TaxID=3345367 RepID=UPI0036287B18
MTKEEFREEYRAWSPTPQLPRLAPPVDRTRRAGGALGTAPGVEADIDWSRVLTGAADVFSKFL